MAVTIKSQNKKWMINWMIDNEYLIFFKKGKEISRYNLNGIIDFVSEVYLSHGNEKIYSITLYIDGTELQIFDKWGIYTNLHLARDYFIELMENKGFNPKNLLSRYFELSFSSIAFRSSGMPAFKYISNDIIEKLRNKQLIIDSDRSELEGFWSHLNASISTKKTKQELPEHLEFFQDTRKASIILCNEYALSLGFNNFGVTKIVGASWSEIEPGEYFYNFNDEGNIELVELPLYTEQREYSRKELTENLELTLYDSQKERSTPIIISQDMIFDFDMDGNQVSMTKSVEGENPVLIKTMFSEFLFGTSYATLKGMSASMPKIDSNVEDLRTIQVILNDKSDIRFEGISIYYDLRRYLGNVKNKIAENSNPNISSAIDTKSSSSLKKSMDDIKMFKELLDSGIITQEEFNQKKKELLGL